MNQDFLLSSYTYQLPPSLIAQAPAVPRDSSRLLVVDSRISSNHATFRDLANWLQPGDLLVLNNTRVIPARLYGRKITGSQVEILLIEAKAANRWLALVKPGKRFTIGAKVEFNSLSTGDHAPLRATVIEKDEATGGRILEFELPTDKSLWEVLDDYGQLPLPPYITDSDAPDERYQTVYSSEPGAIAAPTAGLHFTPELLAELENQGIEQTQITLHVGVGTFRPVEKEQIKDHAMHQEWIDVSAATVAKIKETKARGGRVIAVGTTATRALEGAAKAAQSATIEPFQGQTDLFIYPGYQWQVVDGLITNFHLPGSSLLMLVSAMIGRERLLNLYQEVIAQEYRFYSFGDAMLILPEASNQ
ncbi:MAG: tRNA preQ1(34) S-adenosylmethionine ribosyltransferase-isomerase QueA [Cyanobacteria bacterium J06600_6]